MGAAAAALSRGNGVNLVDGSSPGQKSQIVHWFGLNDDEVTTTDRSRKALEEVVGKLDAATMMDSDKNALNTTGQKALNEVAKNQLPQNSGMCIDVMKWSPTSADAAPAIPNGRTLYWAQYTDRGNGRHLRCGRKALGNGPTDLYERVVVLFHCEI